MSSVHPPGLRPRRRRHQRGAAPRHALRSKGGRLPGQDNAIYREIEKRHDEAIARLQEWIRQPSIAAENIGMQEGAELTKRLALDAGFQHAEIIPTKGHPAVFATLDAGAPKTLGLYFMYDVKQVNPDEWSSPPWEGRLVDMPGKGKVLMGRAATNQKGPQAAFLAALHAMRAAGAKLPVNLVLLAEGEEEIGSPNLPEAAHSPKVRAALSKTIGIFMPSNEQGADGNVAISLGSKGDIELDLIASGERWGRGPTKDIHSSRAARLDQPAWHLVQALNTLVTPTGEPAIDGFTEHVRPVSAAEHAMLDALAARLSETAAKEATYAKVWARDANWRQALEDLVSRPTVTIEGLVGGYMGPGGKTILPHKMTAKLDIRLVPDMTPEDIIAKLKAHLAKRGFGDLELVHQWRRQLHDPDAGGFRAHPRAARRVSRIRDRCAPVAAERGFVAGFRLHRPAAQSPGRALRAGIWRQCACAG